MYKSYSKKEFKKKKKNVRSLMIWTLLKDNFQLWEVWSQTYVICVESKKKKNRDFFGG